MNKAELILTPSGEIYHLRLKPGQLARNIITVGDPERIDLIAPYFDQIEFRVHNREFSTLTGSFQGHRLSVISTGIGTDNIDIAITEADALFNIDFDSYSANNELTSLNFIRIGTSGALQADIEPGDIILSAAAASTDNLYYYYKNTPSSDVEMINQQVSQSLGMRAYTSRGSTSLLDHFSPLGKKGITMTCPGFYGPQGRKLRASLTLPDFLDDLSQLQFDDLKITNFEMETAGIYAMSEILGHQALSINGILANRAKGTFADDPQAVVSGMIDRTMDLVASWLHKESKA